MILATCHLPKAKSTMLTHAYDFLQKKRYAPKSDYGWDDDLADSAARNAALETLLQQHGGSVRVSPDGGDVFSTFNTMRKLGWGEFRLWRERLRTARLREEAQTNR